MLFNSVEFIVFLIAVFAVTWLLARWRLAQTLFLLAASYFFYANWNPYYLGLILFVSTVDYVVGGRIHLTEQPKRRKALLVLSLVANLGVLAVFKYFNFFAVQVAASLNAMGMAVDPVLLRVALPVGISFFTFQSISYTIDIYRRKLEPADSYWQYLLFVSFFPQLVAGPIVRAAHFLPQLRQERTLTRAEGGLGLFLIMSGMLKKVCIADYLAVNLVDRVFENPAWFTSAECLAAVYGYAFQIYCDFSGYTDVAIGAALLLGFHIPENFRTPYAAVNLRDFWRRWHISLSTWLRDYLYIPLGGSRKGPARTYLALAATMLLGGLWHGPAWTFVVWGALHGVALAITRLVQRWRDETQAPSALPKEADSSPTAPSALPKEADSSPTAPSALRRILATIATLVWRGVSFVLTWVWRGVSFVLTWVLIGVSVVLRWVPPPVRRVMAIFLTFHFVCLAWIFFRAQSFGHAWAMLGRLTDFTWGTANIARTVALALGGAFILHYLPERLYAWLRERFIDLPAVLQGAVLAGVGVIVFLVAQSKVMPYIYYQF